MADAAAQEPAIAARAITKRGPSGPVYGPVDLDIVAGGLTVLVAAPGLGRDALLLTLSGRMRPDAGTLLVLGRSQIRDIFNGAALAAIDGVDELAETATVGDLITEKLRWDAHWYKVVRRADARALTRVCGPVFGDLPLPPLSEAAGELSELDAMLLRIALANTRRPPLLVAGDIEQVTTDRDREQLIGRLVALGEHQTVVTASANGVTTAGVRNIVVEDRSRHAAATQQEGQA